MWNICYIQLPNVECLRCRGWDAGCGAIHLSLVLSPSLKEWTQSSLISLLSNENWETDALQPQSKNLNVKTVEGLHRKVLTRTFIKPKVQCLNTRLSRYTAALFTQENLAQKLHHFFSVSFNFLFVFVFFGILVLSLIHIAAKWFLKVLWSHMGFYDFSRNFR